MANCQGILDKDNATGSPFVKACDRQKEFCQKRFIDVGWGGDKIFVKAAEAR